MRYDEIRKRILINKPVKPYSYTIFHLPIAIGTIIFSQKLRYSAKLFKQNAQEIIAIITIILFIVQDKKQCG